MSCLASYTCAYASAKLSHWCSLGGLLLCACARDPISSLLHAQAQGIKRRRFQPVLLLCMVPWILTPACKATFFKVEAMLQMQRHAHASSINVRLSCLLGCV